eukprot:gnl/TRDRNA2_/TRDRNA2_64649_c0_seq1.p1 gnl/TRDRNA2_/TRDRNA2_64649_c0~~gnl/TRDRNA2_/TRDRNA2_64649_c0_seq1.p1  ORF type:complete len:243 (-),score=46.88 gnl/TRDRNA2_/TRDRNA2_64649_c0_seq1:161-889(-)
MQYFFNCCHGMFEAPGQGGTWICSTQVSSLAGSVDEEISGDESSPAYKPHIQSDEVGKPVLAPSNTRRRSRPVGGPGAPEDDKEAAKSRLQRLIRDFAHDAVGPGLEVNVESEAFKGSNGMFQALLRMDRRLSRLEICQPSSTDARGSSVALQVPLVQVKQISKDVNPNEKQDGAKGTRCDNECMLVVTQVNSPDLRLFFESPAARDRAYACLRVFQKSVEQTPEASVADDENSVREASSPA